MATVTRQLLIRPVDDAEDLRLANMLMAETHAENFASSMHWLEATGATYPGFKREHTRIATFGGELAGALRLTTETMRVGEARLKVGGLGWVTTAPRHRHQGVCTGLLQETLRYMRGHGYHVSMLFGIPNFYHRFGYATTLAEYSITLDTPEAASGVSRQHKVRRVKPGDIPAIQKIHTANDSAVACSLLRSSGHIKNKWDRFQETVLFTTQQGKVLGYVLTTESEDALVVSEVGLDEPSVAADILAHCAARAQDEYRPRIQFMLPPEHPFAHYLGQFESRHEMRLSRQSGGMMTFVDLSESLEVMIPEWERLVARSAVADRRCEATLVVEGSCYRVRSNHGAIDIAKTPGRNKMGLSRGDLMHLLTGYTHFEDLFHASRRFVTPEARALLAAIFPKRNPYVHSFDRF